ncbi:uncharacterized protein LOC118456615 [Anopheles albimanus]|uniref:uncharacterized protein LOC118456615 n=1 Tax=Anopheles albimanus TaxID=7167 RepID=UPI00163FB5BE|nr:uncharacterized protein LOC118456615 [Anopheles albimanus]
MAQDEPLDVYSSMSVFYWILRLCGFAPYKLASGAVASAGSQRLTILYSASFVLLYTVAYGLLMCGNEKTGFSRSMIVGNGERIYLSVSFCSTLYSIMNAYAAKDKIERVLKRLNQVDRKVYLSLRPSDIERCK